MNTLIVALLVVLGVDEEAMAGVDIVHRFEIDLSLASGTPVREVAALCIVLLLKLV